MRNVIRLGALLSVVLATSAFAAPFPPGITLNVPDHGVPPPVGSSGPYSIVEPAGFQAGGLFASLIGAPITSLPAGFTGTVDTRVWLMSTGTLGFEYNYHITDTDPEAVRATIGGIGSPWFGIGITDAGALGNGASNNTTSATPLTPADGDPYFLLRDPAISGSGLTLQWRSAGVGSTLNSLGPNSATVFFATDATTVRTGTTGILDSGIVGSADVLVPGGVIPEPGTMLLLGSGLLGFAGVARRRKTK